MLNTIAKRRRYGVGVVALAGLVATGCGEESPGQAGGPQTDGAAGQGGSTGGGVDASIDGSGAGASTGAGGSQGAAGRPDAGDDLADVGTDDTTTVTGDPCADGAPPASSTPGAWTPSELAPDFCGGTGPSRGPTALLQTFASQYSDLAGWEARAKIVREGMQKKMRLYPWPAKTPLKAVIHSRKVNTALGISVENVFFESFPGFFVTGNLYRPLQCSGQIPGILRVHGHGTWPRFGDDFQRHCAAMASMGAIVFGYDMVGKGDSNQVAHCFPEGIMAAQTWNTMRAVDFLLSLGADPKRIAITGESGGGTQAYIGAAMDPRITMSMSAVIVGGTNDGIWMGGCNCEGTGMGINKDTDANNDIIDYETDPIDIAALAAPHFQLIMSDTKDPLAPNAPMTTMPYLKNVYGFYGAAGNVENFIDNTGHNYHLNKRIASYKFLIAKYGIGPAVPDESKYAPYSEGELRCFPPEHPRPDYALKTKDEIVAALLR